MKDKLRDYLSVDFIRKFDKLVREMKKTNSLKETLEYFKKK